MSKKDNDNGIENIHTKKIMENKNKKEYKILYKNSKDDEGYIHEWFNVKKKNKFLCFDWWSYCHHLVPCGCGEVALEKLRFNRKTEAKEYINKMWKELPAEYEEIIC